MSRVSHSPAKRLFTVAILFTMAALAVAYIFLRQPTGAVAEIGKPAPDFTLGILGGDYLSLSELRGQVVMLNFWATWCEPCRDEMPAMQTVYEKYRDEGFEIVGINLQETEVTVRGFVNQLGITFPIVYDLTGEVYDAYLVRPMPTSYFLDRDGIVRFLFIGPMTEQEIEQRVRLLLYGTGEPA